MLIEVKVKTVRTIDGKTRKRNEVYILNKDVFAEAELKVMQELAEEQDSNLLDSYEIQQMKIASVKEVCNQYEGESTFIATLKDIWLETDGTEKQLKYKVLLWANNLTEANNNTLQLARQGYDMQIEGIKQVDYIYLTDDDTREEGTDSSEQPEDC